jgi:hypothetical protein
MRCRGSVPDRPSIERWYTMPRRWLRPSTPSASSEVSPDSTAAAALRAAMVVYLSRRLFGKQLLLAIPVAAVAVLTEQTEDARAAPPPVPTPWVLTGNNNIATDGSNFLGTLNNAPLIFKTNPTGAEGERMRITPDGNVGIGVTNPSAKLSVQSSAGIGVSGSTNGGAEAAGVYGISTGANSKGVIGIANIGTMPYGVWGQSSTGFGVVGSGGPIGVAGSGTVIGVRGSGSGVGVRGSSTGLDGHGVIGIANGGTTAYGVWGQSSAGFGVVGSGPTGVAGFGQDVGVHGSCSCGFGVRGTSQGIGSEGGAGVHGVSTRVDGVGVFGVAQAGDHAIAIGGMSSTGYAGYFSGKVKVLGAVDVIGNLSVLGAKSFVMDHPLDPAHKYLYHAAVEAPAMMNLYTGIVTLNESGSAWVDLPSYFEALNKDFCYTLTPVGAPGPQLYIAQEIKGNRFQIAGGTANMKVSWMVTSTRNDPYAQAHPLQVEVAKSASEQGTYLYPDGYGQSQTTGLHYAKEQQALANAAAAHAAPDELALEKLKQQQPMPTEDAPQAGRDKLAVDMSHDLNP